MFSSGFNAANQSSAACDRRLQQSVETSTPPFEEVSAYGNFLAVQWEIGGIPLPHTLPSGYFPTVILLRMLLVAILPLFFAACASSSKKPKSSAHMYNGDESPHIHMFTEAEAPGSELHN